MSDFERRLDDFLAEFSPDNQERILRYALDHVLPRMKARRAQPAQVGQVLTHRDVLEEWTNTTLEPCTHQEAFVRGARWAEQVVLKKFSRSEANEKTQA